MTYAAPVQPAVVQSQGRVSITQSMSVAAPVMTYAAPPVVQETVLQQAPLVETTQTERIQTGVRTEERPKDIKFVYGPPSIPGEVISERLVDPSELVDIIEVPVFS